MKTHGKSNTRLYRTWSAMKQRCFNPNDSEYKNYGGRGITVSGEWIEFEQFYKWAVKSGYKQNLTIDRIDVNGHYEPNNCKWSTLVEQMNNKRNNVTANIYGEILTLSQISRKYGIDYGTVEMRHLRRLPLTSGNLKKRPVIRDDGCVYESIAEASRHNGVCESRIRPVASGERKRTAGHSFSYLAREKALKECEK